MSAKVDFLIKAIEEVQETNRFLDAKAGVLVAFESSLLVIAISSLSDNSRLQLIKNLMTGGAGWYSLLLIVYFTLYVIALLGHILITLRVIFPAENPESHVSLGDLTKKTVLPAPIRSEPADDTIRAGVFCTVIKLDFCSTLTSE